MQVFPVMEDTAWAGSLSRSVLERKNVMRRLRKNWRGQRKGGVMREGK
jgi:hypothetical protein